MNSYKFRGEDTLLSRINYTEHQIPNTYLIVVAEHFLQVLSQSTAYSEKKNDEFD